MIRECRHEADFNQLLNKSRQKPVFLIKHSTACGISAAAWKEFSNFAEEGNEPEYWQVLVRENRSLSTMISRKTGIRHQSPQVILFVDGKAVWNDSHQGITSDNLRRRLEVLGGN